MKKSLRNAIIISTSVISVIAFSFLGFVLDQNGIYGPLIADGFLTDWSNWKYVVLVLTIVTTLLVYALVNVLTRKKS